MAKENKKKFWFLFLWIFLAYSSSIIAKTLTNVLLLHNYETSLLPYFYILQALLFIGLTLATANYQIKFRNSFTLSFNAVTAFLMLPGFIALKMHLPLAPFILATLLSLISASIIVMPWNYVSDIFDVQEFKRYSKHFQAIGTLGTIIGGGIMSLVSWKFGNLALLFVIMMTEIAIVFCLLPIRKYVPLIPQKSVSQKSRNAPATLKNNQLYRYMSYFIIILCVLNVIIDFVFKLGLSSNIENVSVEKLTNIVYVASSIGILIVQLFLFDPILKIMGSKKTILIYPILLTITVLLAFLFPILSLILILFTVNEILSQSTGTLAKNLYLNILPPHLRELSRLRLNGIIKSFSYCAGGILLFFVATYLTMRLSLLLLLLLCMIFLIFTFLLMGQYRNQLTQSVYLRRFNPDVININHENTQFVQDLFEHIFEQNDVETILFGLDLLDKNPHIPLPQSFHALFQLKDQKILRETAKILSNHPDANQFADVAQHLFLTNSDNVILWYTALYLLHQKTVNLLSHAESLIQKNSNAAITTGALILLKKGDLEQQRQALECMVKFSSSEKYQEEKWFLRFLNELSNVNKEKYLIQFIRQPNKKLQERALNQLIKNPGPDYLAALVNLLDKNIKSPALIRSLTHYGEKVVDLLMAKIMQNPNYSAKMSCIIVLSSIPGQKAEQALMEIIQNTDDFMLEGQIAKHFCYRRLKIGISKPLADFILKQIRQEIIVYIRYNNKSLHYESKIIKTEILSRIQFIKKRILYYLVAMTASIDLMNAMPILTSLYTNTRQKAMALELFDTLISDRKLFSLIIQLFTDPPENSYGSAVDDPWLNNFITSIENNNMENIYIITKLRKIDFFQNLEAESLQSISDCCSIQDMSKGEIIFKEGDPGDGLYIIDSGEAMVYRGQEPLATLKPGNYFGELALLSDRPRQATVIAMSEGTLIYIGSEDFDRITDEIPEIMKSITKQIINYLGDKVNLQPFG